MSSTKIPKFVGFYQYFISLEQFENEEYYKQNANAMQIMQNEWHAASRHLLQRVQRTPTIVAKQPMRMRSLVISLDIGKLLREFQAVRKDLRGVNDQNEKEANYYASDVLLGEL